MRLTVSVKTCCFLLIFFLKGYFDEIQTWRKEYLMANDEHSTGKGVIDYTLCWIFRRCGQLTYNFSNQVNDDDND